MTIMNMKNILSLLLSTFQKQMWLSIGHEVNKVCKLSGMKENKSEQCILLTLLFHDHNKCKPKGKQIQKQTLSIAS